MSASPDPRTLIFDEGDWRLLDDLRDFLAGSAAPPVKLKCGRKACSVTIDEVGIGNGSLPMVVGRVPLDRVPVEGIDGGAGSSRRGIGAGVSIAEHGMGDDSPRLKYRCHGRRCTAQYTITGRSLFEAYVRAVRLGQRSIVLGVDL